MKKLIVTIPAFNEESTIAEVIGKIPLKIEGIDKIETIVINDGSTDKTEEIAESTGAEVISHAQNLGLGIAFKKGMERALANGADIIVTIDADGQFDPQDIARLVEPVIKGQAEVVTASRFISPDYVPKMSKIKVMGNKLMSFIISKIVKEKFYDVSCGFRAYSREAALRMNLFGKFTYTQETFIDLASKNVSILEIPVKVKGERDFGRSKIASNLFQYGFNTLRIILSAFRDYMPLRLMFYICLFFIFVGVVSGSFFLVHYVRTGAFKPHTWAGFLSFSSFILAVFMLIAGVFMETFSRMRMNQEQLLYFSRKAYYEKLRNKE